MAEKIVFASGKGGVGKSSLCVGIGRALSALGKKVLLIDCDCLRTIDILTGVTRNLVYDWGDLLMNRCDKEEASYFAGDVTVLTCPYSYSNVTEKEMKKLIAFYDESFDYILLDAPAGVGEGFNLAVSVADRVIMVSTPDSVCVRSSCIAGREAMSKGKEDIRLIINRVKKKDITKGRLLNVDAVIDSTQLGLLGVVPEDGKIKYSAMGESLYCRGQVSFKPMTNIAKRICGEYITLRL